MPARIRRGASILCATLLLLAGPALAGPWAQAGDPRLRSDIEVLAAAGVIDNVTMTWPLPWGGILARLERPGALEGQPAYVRAAAERVRARGMEETKLHHARVSMTADATNGPDVVRGFDAMGREDEQGLASLDYLWSSTAVHLALGAQSTNRVDHQVFVPDGSYIAQRIGNAGIYVGYVPHWWGPGWISALSVSNNARPVPQVGISRIDTAPFETPWLSWLGPWQMEFFVGVLDGPRVARNTIYDGFRFGFSPFPHLEIGLARTDEMCGTGHPCSPIRDYFVITNNNTVANNVNDQGNIDIKYSGAFGKWAYEVYAQLMNEDTNPVVHSGTSHLAGASLWLPMRGGIGRLTVEYTSSLATKDIWGGGVQHDVAYNNYSYVDGMRYRDRSLGFSLDSDSQLLSVQWNYTTDRGHSFTFTYHHADISDSVSPGGNVVTSAPVKINMFEGRIGVPFEVNQRAVQLDLEARFQDDQPRPDKGFLATVEAALTVNL
jgi:Capsule assembly protein Wzi